jgi:hypothetical protein
MSILDFLDDYLFGPCNLIDRLEGLVRGMAYQDFGHKFTVRYADRGGRHTRAEIEALLARYGIAVYGRTHDANCMHFLVKKRQASWAEYILLHAGVEVTSPLIDPRNQAYVAQHPPGWLPRPWNTD